MSLRQETLTAVLTSEYGTGRYYPNALNLTDLKKAGLMSEVQRTFKRLGGILTEAPLSFGKWDICLNDFIVELDEEQHFNRYRAVTLDSYIYHMEKGFDVYDYGKYCKLYEENCLKKSSWGKFWTSPSTEKQFGNSGFKGNLETLGSPRWKQRAFYDYLRDIFAIIYRIPLIRVSIYDKIIANGLIKSVGTILIDGNTSDLNEIVKFIGQKTTQLI